MVQVSGWAVETRNCSGRMLEVETIVVRNLMLLADGDWGADADDVDDNHDNVGGGRRKCTVFPLTLLFCFLCSGVGLAGLFLELVTFAKFIKFI